MQGTATHYDVLGLKPSCSPDDIKAAYRRLALKSHPDKGGDAVLFQLVQNAYECLSDPNKRRQYDRECLNAQRMSAAPAGSSSAGTRNTGANGHRSTTTAPPPSDVYMRAAPPPNFDHYFAAPQQPQRYYSAGWRGRLEVIWDHLRDWALRSKPPGRHHRWYRHLAWWGPGLLTLAVSCWWWTNQAAITSRWPGVLLRLPDAPHLALLALVPTLVVSPVVGGLWLRQRRGWAVFWFLALGVVFTVGAVWALGPLLLAVAGIVGLALLAVIFGN